ncbi:MAG TPA: hypothetical protein VGJ26_11330, partial [Pirellulales bacterium]
MTAMRIGTISFLCCWAFLLWIASIAGCGRPAAQTTSIQPAAAEAGVPRVVVNQSAGGEAVSVDVVGLAPEERKAFALLDQAERAAALRVLVTQEGAREGVGDLPAIGGDYAVEGEALRFTPRYPL